MLTTTLEDIAAMAASELEAAMFEDAGALSYADPNRLKMVEATRGIAGRLVASVAAQLEGGHRGYVLYSTDGTREVVYTKQDPEAEAFATIDEARAHLEGEGGTVPGVRAWACRVTIDTEL